MSSLWRLSSRSRRTMFFAKKSPWQLPPNQLPPVPQQELVNEEACPGYSSGSATTFYPATPREPVLARKFQLIVKIG